MGTYRIVVCLDIEASSPEEAYAKLYKNMPRIAAEGIDWESTDEWYDDNGAPLSEEQVFAAREAVLLSSNKF